MLDPEIAENLKLRSLPALRRRIYEVSVRVAYAHSEQKKGANAELAKPLTLMHQRCDLFWQTRISVLEYHMQKNANAAKHAQLKSGIKMAKLKSGKNSVTVKTQTGV